MTSLVLKNKLTTRLKQGIARIRENIDSLNLLLDEWKENLERLEKLEDLQQEDQHLLLSFLSFQDDAVQQLNKIQGQLLFIETTDIMQRSINSKTKPGPKIVPIS